MIAFGIGIHRDTNTVIMNIDTCNNIAENPSVEFIADPLCIYELHKRAKDMDMDIVAIIHSHPATPIPSFRDLKGMMWWPLVWIIISSISGEYKAWKLNNGKILEVPLILY